MTKILTIAFLISLSACFHKGLLQDKNNYMKTFEIGSASIELKSDYQVYRESESDQDYSFYVKKDDDSLLIWVGNNGVIMAEIYLDPTGEFLNTINKPSDVDLKNWTELRELKRVRKIEIQTIGDAFILIDNGPRFKIKCKNRMLDIMYYDTKLKQKIVFTSVCKNCKKGFDVVSNKFRKDIVKALKTIKFN